MIKETTAYYGIYRDAMFKKIFGNSNNLEPLKLFLKETINLEPKKMIIKSPDLLGNKYTSKRTYLDLLLELDDGTKVNIEINSSKKNEIIERNLRYIFRVFDSEVKSGDEYKKDINRIYQINVNTYDKNIDKPFEKYKIMEEEGKSLTEMLQIININVSYFREKCYTNSEELNKTAKLFGLIGADSLEEITFLREDDYILKDILNQAIEYSKDQELVKVLDYEKMRDELEEIAVSNALEQGIEQGIEKGINQGSTDKAVTIAKNMLNMNLDINIISKATGLTVKQIRELH